MKATSLDAYRFFHQGTEALAEMEANGIAVDVPYLDKKLKETETQIRELSESLKDSSVYSKWTRVYGTKTNLDSTIQLADILFKHLGYASPEKTKTGKFKADEASIEKVNIPFVKDYFKVKKLKKAHGTYLTGFKREVRDGLIRPFYNLAGGSQDDEKGGAKSMRGSVQAPNFQNIPNRDPVIGKMLRSCFIARKPTNRLAEFDYAQIEVRIAACYNKDPVLIKYIKDKTTDMHRDMAMQIFCIQEHEVDKKSTRDCSKNQFVFPEFYGNYYVACARDIWTSINRRNFKVKDSEETILERLAKNGIKSLGDCDPNKTPVKGTFEYHMKQVEDHFWNTRFKVYTKWKKKWYNDYLSNGYFDMLTGFRISGHMRRNAVINYPVQGCAFHCLLWSIIEISKALKKRKLKALLVGQIHDCLIMDIPEEELDEVLGMVKEIMTKAIRKAWDWIIIPLEIEAEVCPARGNWSEKAVVAI